MIVLQHKSILGSWAVIGFALAAAGGAAAQQGREAGDHTASQPIPPMPLTDWRYDDVYDGWYADAVVDRPIYGPHGDEIGNVKNLLLNTRGEIVALIAEVGGFLDIADTHVAIPWGEIERRDGRVYSPITVDTAERYGMFTQEYFRREDVGTIEVVDEFFKTGAYIWKATALLDDYVTLSNGEAFGYVTDLVFNDMGQLIAVVAVEARGDIDERGVYAFPWDDRGWRPGFDHYTLRHAEEEIRRLPKIDYSEFD